MSRSVRSHLHSPALWVAALLVILLHGIGTWWVQGGWRGAHPGEHVGPVSQPGAGMVLSLTQVRLHRPALQADGPMQTASAELGQGAPQEPVSASPARLQSASSAALLSSHYLSADELDQGPEPQPGWVLDESAFPAGRQTSLLVRLWVASDGRIDQVAVVHADPPGEWALRATQPMSETRMSPPLMNGKPVAAVVMVEISAQDEGFH